MSASPDQLHPAQSRGFRELYAAARQVANHHRSLADRLAVPAFGESANAAQRMLDELRTQTARYDLHGQPAAQGVGVSGARARSSVVDRFLERNQAERIAVLDLQHVVTLLGYLATASETNGNSDLAGFCRRWHAELREVESRVRDAAIDSGRDLDAAVEPFDPSPVGRAAHGVGYWFGTFGEWFDRRAARRRS
ncbi:MAG: hypothetical protein QOJ12_242 [Thermoleophilales bacterium]|nr:hypothetical protein [Thermoleophilales bacterium]